MKSRLVFDNAYPKKKGHLFSYHCSYVIGVFRALSSSKMERFAKHYILGFSVYASVCGSIHKFELRLVFKTYNISESSYSLNQPLAN